MKPETAASAIRACGNFVGFERGWGVFLRDVIENRAEINYAGKVTALTVVVAYSREPASIRFLKVSI